MLKIRFVILFGVVLGGVLSFAAVRARPLVDSHSGKKAEAEGSANRKISGER